MRCLRVLMLWMLALALPLQGMAAVAMLHCASKAPVRHHAGIQAQAAAAEAAQGGEQAGHGGHVHGLHAGHAHHDQRVTGAAPDGPMAQASHDASLPASSHAHAAGHSCSACAACCVALALPPAMPVLAAALSAPTTAATLVAPSPSFLTAGPERPPRSLHA